MSSRLDLDLEFAIHDLRCDVEAMRVLFEELFGDDNPTLEFLKIDRPEGRQVYLVEDYTFAAYVRLKKLVEVKAEEIDGLFIQSVEEAA